MPRLGLLLVRAGALSEDSVNRALAVQGFTGGRLGTLLLERGSLSEDDVGGALAQQHGCEYVSWRQLAALPTSLMASLPLKFAIRHAAIPVEAGESFLRVVLRDPSNLRILDELFFVTGKKIVPAAAPEVRIYQALEKFYGERRTPRFAILAEKLSRPTAPSVIQKPLPPPPDFSSPILVLPGAPVQVERPSDLPPVQAWKAPDQPPIGWGGLAPPPAEPKEEEDVESIPWEELPPTGSWSTPAPEASSPAQTTEAIPPRSSPAPAPVSPWRQTRALAPTDREGPEPPGMPAPADFGEILAARQRDRIFEASLRALRRRFPTSAIFVARADGVVGLAGAGEKVDLGALRALDIPWSEPSVFLNVRLNRLFYLGPIPPLASHGPLADALGGWPAECIVQPVLMREKTVAFLYAACSSAQGATPSDLTYIRELAGATAAALAASIRLKKKQVI